MAQWLLIWIAKIYPLLLCENRHNYFVSFLASIFHAQIPTLTRLESKVIKCTSLSDVPIIFSFIGPQLAVQEPGPK